jgi:hypothetical protein
VVSLTAFVFAIHSKTVFLKTVSTFRYHSMTSLTVYLRENTFRILSGLLFHIILNAIYLVIDRIWAQMDVILISQDFV